MRLKLYLQIILSLFFSLATYCQANELIIGKWVQTERTKGDLGGIFIFYEDGKSTVIFGAIVESKYIIEGDNLIEIYQGNRSKNETIKYSFLVDNENLTIKKLDSRHPKDCNVELKMDRINGSKEIHKSIIGKWTYEHCTGGKALVQYTTDGRKLLCVPMVYETGHYILEDENLTIKMENGRSYTRQVKIEKEKLTLLKTKDKKEEIYDRF